MRKYESNVRLVYSRVLGIHAHIFIFRKTRVLMEKETKLKQMTLNYHLPAELLTEILSRLPVKTLLLCTSVSKSWYSLITSPFFITTHQLNNRNNPAPLLLLRYHSKMYDHSLRYCSLHYDIDTFEEFVELDLPHITKENRYIRIAGTCNGLVCLYDLNEYIVALWNPSLKKSIILPKPCAVRKSCDFYHIGFGIDPISNDYKIVRLANTYLILDGVLELLTLLEVELFELSTSSWRNINVGDYPYVISPGNNQPVFFSGVVHWAGYNQKYKVGSGFHPFIVSFDMRNDTLGVVMAPPCAQNSQDWCACIILFGESLSIFHRDVDHSCCLWVMKEYGVGSSWMKQFTIDLGKRSVGRPLCCSKNGDILLEKRNWDYLGRDLVSYDPKTKLIKNLEIHVPASLYLDIYEYKESLVLTKSINDLWRKENVVACQGTPVLPREDDEVNKKN
ncbi:hypothetical protein LguiB_020403 [Lonicera macranthoides]